MEIYQLGYYISKENHTKKITPKREVLCSEIEFYTSGGNKSIVNDKEYIQEECNILVSKKGDIRYSVDDFECFAVHFSSPETDELIKTLPCVFKVFDSKKVLDIFKEMTIAYTKGTKADILLAKAKILELVSFLCSENSRQSHGRFSEYSKNVFLACRFMEENFSSHITLSDIASKIALSPNFFHTVFKSIIGKTPSEYLLDIRLNTAKNMLVNTDLSLLEIAVSCGFESQAYFCYVFKKHLAATPKKYRTENRLTL